MADYLIRPAETRDLDAVAGIYNRIHDAEEQGRQTIGWLRDVYPVRQTAQAALDREELYVLETEGAVLGAAILNRAQVITYAQGHWAHDAPEEQVFVLHTLVIAPEAAGRGYGRAFVAFYEDLARKNGCTELRMDTNERNLAARTLYHKLGYTEVDILPTVFNGISGVNLVLLEKYLGA